MKNIKLIPVALLSLLTLSACATSLPQNAPKDTVTIEQTAVIQDAESTVMLSRYGTGMNCELLKAEGAVDACKSQMNEMIGNMFESEIMSSFDVDRCKELPGDLGVSCQSRLEESGVKGPVSKAEADKFQEILRGSFPEPKEGEVMVQRYPNYDVKQCIELKTPGYQAYCEKQVNERVESNLMDEIFLSKDVSRCEELKDAQRQETCKLLMAS